MLTVRQYSVQNGNGFTTHRAAREQNVKNEAEAMCLATEWFNGLRNRLIKAGKEVEDSVEVIETGIFKKEVTTVKFYLKTVETLEEIYVIEVNK